MSSTGAWVAPSEAFAASLESLRRWRAELAEGLGMLRRWGESGRLIDEQASARLAHLERRLASERLTIAFVGEQSRGKSELINALFFGEQGAKLRPASGGKILCPVEILWDPARAPSIRLLPIETRDAPRALREHLMEIDTWHEVPLDPGKPETLAVACEALTQSRDVGGANVPRWRFAVVNYPHPLLAAGLTFLDTAGFNTLASEPELSFHRVPDAAAVVFVISAESDITPADQALWSEHVATIGGIEESCFVVLNKIDGLRDGARGEGQVLSEIDRQMKSVADALGVAPTRIFALSAKQGLAAKLAGDRDALIRSRVYRLEQSLAQGIVHQRRLAHAAGARAEVRGVLAETRALITSRLGFAEEQLQEIAALQGKNQKLVELLARKAGVERGRLEQARAMMSGLRTVHNRHAGELERLLDPAAARAQGQRVREAVESTTFTKGIGEVLDGFFRESRERISRAIVVIDEARKVMSAVGRKMTEEYQIATVEAAPFGTERFLVELDRLEEHCRREFKGGSSMFLRSRKALGTLFFDSVAMKVIHVFEIADRETRTWMGGFIRPLEAQINAYQDQSNSRIEGMGRIQNAEVDLLAKLDELKQLAAKVAAQRDQWEAHQKRLMALLDVERQPSLA
jgi:GTP-binding protein EngB required for normal cell division